MHADGDVGVNDRRDRLERRKLRQLRLNQIPLPEQQKLGIGMSGQRDRGAGNDDGRADVAPHGVKRDSNLLRHERPGNLISSRLLGWVWHSLSVAIAEDLYLPAGDNSLSLLRHNLLTTDFGAKAPPALNWNRGIISVNLTA